MQVQSGYRGPFVVKAVFPKFVNGIHSRLNIVSLSRHSSGQFLVRFWPVLALFVLRWVHYGINDQLLDSDTVRVWTIFNEFLEQAATSQTH